MITGRLRYFQSDKFFEGIKHLPMIRDIAYLMSDDQVKKIFGRSDYNFIVGETLTEEIPVSLPWEKLFNTHLGVFGNTGSGKSNTLTNLYTTLFSNKLDKIIGKSHFESPRVHRRPVCLSQATLPDSFKLS